MRQYSRYYYKDGKKRYYKVKKLDLSLPHEIPLDRPMTLTEYRKTQRTGLPKEMRPTLSKLKKDYQQYLNNYEAKK